MTTKISLKATDEQIKGFELVCDRNEAMLASTLMRRIGASLPAEEATRFIREWFKTVRTMTVAAHAMSGIQITVVEE